MELPIVLEDLKKEVFILNKLLQEPEPGLMSWNLYVAEKWHNIIKLYSPRLGELRKKLLIEALEKQSANFPPAT